ncbi:MAG TPA: hypothetical protein VGB37_03170 [Candidatus Lokiarchaeia archaeon]
MGEQRMKAEKEFIKLETKDYNFKIVNIGDEVVAPNYVYRIIELATELGNLKYNFFAGQLTSLLIAFGYEVDEEGYINFENDIQDVKGFEFIAHAHYVPNTKDSTKPDNLKLSNFRKV